ncbi:MAG: hypothetical protein U0869_19090 [Chloroflexota bacterium]
MTGPSDPTHTVEAPEILPMGRAGREIRAPWAAGVAGLLFSVLFTGALVLLRQPQLASMDAAALSDWYADGGDTAAFIGATYLAPFAGIAFLWFVAVIRDQIGDREDRFFATVFLGSGILFVALLFIAAAMIASLEVAVRYLHQGAPTPEMVATIRPVAYTILFVFSTRAAALFMFAVATVGRRSQVFPRWFSAVGYLIGIALLVVVTLWDWFVLLLPAWVAFVSLFVLRRERRRLVAERHAEAAAR